MQARHRRRDGRGRGRLRDRRRRPRTTATRAGRCRRASPTSTRCRRCSQPLRDARQGRRRAAARREGHARRRVRVAAGRAAVRSRGPRCSRSRAIPWHEKIMAANTRPRAEGIEVWPQVSCRPLDVPDEPARAVHVQHAPRVPGAHGPSARRRAWRRTAIPAWRARAWEELAGRARRAARSTSTRCSSRSRTTHPELIDRNVTDIAERARRATPLDVMLDLSLDENLETRFTSVLANNDPEAIAWLLPAGHGAARPRRLGRARRRSSATRASRPTCSATGCATRK